MSSPGGATDGSQGWSEAEPPERDATRIPRAPEGRKNLSPLRGFFLKDRIAHQGFAKPHPWLPSVAPPGLIQNQAGSQFNLLRILRLIQLHGEAAGHFEVRHKSVAMIGHRLGELNSFGLQLGDRCLDVIAVEGNVVRPRRLTSVMISASPVAREATSECR